MAVNSNVREGNSFSKKVGFGKVKVLAINPDREELKNLIGLDLENEVEYTKTKEIENDGEYEQIDTVRIAFYVQEESSNMVVPVNFYLENQTRENNAKDKLQFRNKRGMFAWGENEDTLPSFFLRDGAEFQPARVGEEDLYNFVKYWLKLDYNTPDFELDLEFEKLIQGDVSILTELINSELAQGFIALFTVRGAEKDDEIRYYQQIYNRGFIPSYEWKFILQLRDEETVNKRIEYLKEMVKKNPKTKLKHYERLMLKVKDNQYPLNDEYVLRTLVDFDEPVLQSDAPIITSSNEELSSNY